MKTLTVTALILFGAASCSDGASNYPGRETIAAGTIPLLDSQGVHEELRRMRGKPLLVNCWAMWCAPCVAELPELGEITLQMRAAGGDVVALCVELTGDKNLSETKDRLPRFIARRDLPFHIWLLTETGDETLWKGFQLPIARKSRGIPVTLAIDAAGKVVDLHEGQASRRRLREMVAAATR